MNKSYAAFAQIDITPQFPVELIGFNRGDSLSRGVLDPLLAQALLLKTNNETSCIIAVDKLGMTTPLNDRIREAVAGILRIPVSRIMICYSHTHSGPDAGKDTPDSKRYFDFLLERICACVKNASERFFPCQVGWGVSEAEIGVNRRKGCDVVDKRIGILKIVNALTLKTEVLLLRVSAHGNVLTGDNYLVSADFFGAARERLSKEYGCNVMVTQGASGNIKPLHQGKVEDLRKTAVVIADSVRPVIGKIPVKSIESLRTYSIKPLFVSDVPAEDVAKRIAADAMTECKIDGTRWLADVAKLRSDGITEQSSELEIQFFAINEGCLCGTPNDPFTEISLEIAYRLKDNFFFYGGYTNGCNGYFPTKEEWRKGGYEILYSYLMYYQYFGRVMPFREDAADKLVGIICEEWAKIKSSSI